MRKVIVWYYSHYTICPLANDDIKNMYSRFSRLIITILLLFISGCASFEDHPLNAVESVARIEARSLSNPQLRQFIHSAVGDKNSWDLDTLTLAAIYYHSDVTLAQALAESAAITTAEQRPNPSLTLSPTW